MVAVAAKLSGMNCLCEAERGGKRVKQSVEANRGGVFTARGLDEKPKELF